MVLSLALFSVGIKYIRLLDKIIVIVFGTVGMVAVHLETFPADFHNLLTSFIRSPIQRITGTAIEFPSALYLGPSGHLSAGFLRYGI